MTNIRSSRGRNSNTRRGCATSENQASQSPHKEMGSFQVLPPSRVKKSSLSPHPMYRAGALPRPNKPARFTGSTVLSPAECFQVRPPSSLQLTPPSFAIQILPPSKLSWTLFWLYGKLTPLGAFSVMSKSEV